MPFAKLSKDTPAGCSTEVVGSEGALVSKSVDSNLSLHDPLSREESTGLELG